MSWPGGPRGPRFPLLVWGFASLSLLQCTGDASVPASETGGTEDGAWGDSGLRPRLERVRQVRLESEAEGFIVRLHDKNFVFSDGEFFATDGLLGSGVLVFDSLGAFVDRIPTGDRSRILGLHPLGGGELLATDEQAHVLLRIHRDGMVDTVATSTRGHGNPIVTVGGLDRIRHAGEDVVLVSIFDDYRGGEDHVTKSRLVGAFSDDGRLLSAFGRHSNEYRRNNWMSYWMSTFVARDDRIYLVESGLPNVRVYSAEGDSIGSFGVPGRHYRAVGEIPDDATIEELSRIVAGYSSTVRIETVRTSPREEPVIAVFYKNLRPGYFENERDARYTKTYAVLYDPDGRHLHADLELPGVLLDVTPDGTLVVNLDDDPTHRVIGLYRMVVEPVRNRPSDPAIRPRDEGARLRRDRPNHANPTAVKAE